MNKQELRQVFLQKRKAAAPELRHRWSQQIEAYVMEYIEKQKVRCVMVYAAFRDEVETEGIIRKLLAGGICVALPKCYEKGKMSAYQIQNFDELVPGRFGILEPPEEHLIEPAAFDLVLVPGCGFGRDGSRLGYGGGFYDRYLPGCKGARVIGLGYELSIADAFPIEAFDVLMDAVITENGVMNKV